MALGSREQGRSGSTAWLSASVACGISRHDTPSSTRLPARERGRSIVPSIRTDPKRLLEQNRRRAAGGLPGQSLPIDGADQLLCAEADHDTTLLLPPAFVLRERSWNVPSIAGDCTSDACRWVVRAEGESRAAEPLVQDGREIAEVRSNSRWIRAEGGDSERSRRRCGHPRCRIRGRGPMVRVFTGPAGGVSARRAHGRGGTEFGGTSAEGQSAGNPPRERRSPGTAFPGERRSVS